MRFSIPAYLAAMLAASETVAVIVGAVLSFGTTTGLLLVAIIVAPLGGLLALPVCLPVALIALVIVNRLKLERPLSYGLVGAGLSGVMSLAVVVVVVIRRPEFGLVFFPLLATAAGFAGGFTYRCVARQEMRNILI